MMFANLPEHLPRAILEFFFTPFLVPEKIFIITGVLILTYSVVRLRMKRKEGLVTSGPYQWIRHPQYLGFVLVTIGLTSWSVWILNNTFGIGFLSPIQTIGLWFIELFAYILLAYVEEKYLTKEYGEQYENYEKQVPFFIPFLKVKKTNLEILISTAIPTILLLGLLMIGYTLPPIPIFT